MASDSKSSRHKKERPWVYKSFFLVAEDKKRRIEVYTSYPEAARMGTGAADNEEVREEKIGGLDLAFRKGLASKSVGRQEIYEFYSGMSRCMLAGASVTQALEISAGVARTAYFRGVIAGMWQVIAKDGASLGEAMEEFPEAFAEVAVSLIKAGEVTGETATILGVLAERKKEENVLMKKIMGGLYYPGALILMTIIAVLIMNFFVFPKMIENFKSLGADLPTITKVVMRMSNFLRAYPWVLLIPVALVVLMISFKKEVKESTFFQWLIVRVPVIGSMFRGAILVRSLQTLSMLIQSGVSVAESFSLTKKVAGHREYENYFQKILDRLLEGQEPPEAFMACRTLIGDYGLHVANQVKIASFSGDTSGALSTVTDVLTEEVAAKAENLPKTIEPIMLAIIGIIVGFLIAAMYLPNLYLVLDLLKKN